MTSLRQQTKVLFTQQWTRIPFTGDLNSSRQVKAYLDQHYADAEEIYRIYNSITQNE